MQDRTRNFFGVSIRELNTSHLSVLRTTEEGWFHDYKREMLTAKVIGKHMCALANKFGGWLYFGIDEDRSTRCAGSYLGIPTDSVGDALTLIREACDKHCQPNPYYEHQVVNGPCEEIGLSEDRSIILLYVHEGLTTPYIHSSGSVYTRVADSSTPTPVNSRVNLELLWQKSKEANLRLEAFFKQNSSQNLTADRPTLQFYLLPDPGLGLSRSSLSLTDFKEILGPENSAVHAPFQSLHVMPHGYVARQTENNDPHSQVLTFKYWMDGNAKLELPLTVYRGEELRSIRTLSDHVDEFLSLIDTASLDRYRFVDLNQLLISIASFGELVSKLHAHDGIDDPLRCAVFFNSLYGTTPYLDSQIYTKEVRNNGIAIVQHNDLAIPLQCKSVYLTSLGSFDRNITATTSPLSQIGFLIGAFETIAPAFGFSLNNRHADEWKDFIVRFAFDAASTHI